MLGLVARLLVLTLVLNVVRYVVGAPLDGVLVFPIVALAKGLLYPRIVSSSRPTAGSPAP